LAHLQKSSIKFVAVDNPHASPLTIHILAAVAQDERERISARIKAALVEAKKRGTKLGPQPAGIAAIKRYAGNPLGIEGNKRKANNFARDLAPIIAEIRKTGITTQERIAQELTRRGIRTVRGSVEWTQPRVGQLLQRIAGLERKEEKDRGETNESAASRS